jgi:hypothetical protein
MISTPVPTRAAAIGPDFSPLPRFQKRKRHHRPARRWQAVRVEWMGGIDHHSCKTKTVCFSPQAYVARPDLRVRRPCREFLRRRDFGAFRGGGDGRWLRGRVTPA